MKDLKAGQRVSYYHYSTIYTGNVEDGISTPEQIRCGAITSVSKDGKFAKVRSDASGLVVTVPTRRIR